MDQSVVQNGHNKERPKAAGKKFAGKKSVQIRAKQKIGRKAGAKGSAAKSSKPRAAKQRTTRLGGSIEPCYVACGLLISKARNVLKWSQEKLAQKTGFSRVSVALIETGKQRISLHDLSKVAEAMKLRVGRLLPKEWT